MTGQAAEARELIATNPTWYHTIAVAPGVVTPGYVDMRSAADRVLPADLSGLRSLDVGTFDGFWAFAMEARGAQVVAVDVETVDSAEWPPNRREQLEREAQQRDLKLGTGFEIASRLLGSEVERRICNIYDLEPDAIGGQVDLAFVGTLLLHLRDPVRGLEAVRSVLGESGELRVIEPISLKLTAMSPRRPAAEFQTLKTPFNWWVANLAALRAWLETAGFEVERRLGFVRPPGRREMRQTYVALTARPT